MPLTALDWTLIGAYLVFVIGVGVAFSGKAGGSLRDYFVSGRSLPWWLAGTSMVATTFSSDTPLYVTNVIWKFGAWGNWQWWTMATGGMFSAFLLARLWRRAAVVTDVELTELRYSGRPAAVLRGFRALYFALPINVIIMGWVLLSMVKILDVILGWDKVLSIGACVAVTLFYTVTSGFWGVVVSDFPQFFISIGAATVLAVVAVDRVGGMGALLEAVASRPETAHAADYFPPAGAEGLLSPALVTFFGYVAFQWWAHRNADGGGLVIQRMSACRDEREALLATLWFNGANYVLRTWPWVIAALCTLVLYPDIADPERAYPLMAMEIMPDGLRGLMVLSFLGAFMSTIDSQLNWGASYLVNDVYVRFLAPGRSDRHYVAASRWATVLLMGITAVATYFMESIEGAFTFLISFSAGVGLVYILRWFWWRINAWSEIAAMLASSCVSSAFYLHGNYTGHPHGQGTVLLTTIAVATVSWMVVTFATAPVEREHLVEFYRRVRPPGPGWAAIAAKAPDVAPPDSLGAAVAGWLLGTASVYLAMFGTGDLCFGSIPSGLGMVAAAFVLAWGAVRVTLGRAAG